MDIFLKYRARAFKRRCDEVAREGQRDLKGRKNNRPSLATILTRKGREGFSSSEPLPVFAMAESIHDRGIARVMEPLLREWEE